MKPPSARSAPHDVERDDLPTRRGVTQDALSRTERPPHRLDWSLALLFAALFGFALVQYGDSLSRPFWGDDYAILHWVRNAGFPQAFSRDHALLGWYRPVSRELWFWLMSQVAPHEPVIWRLLGAALWSSLLVTYYALARRLLDPLRAAFATVCVASLAYWGTPLLWAAGVQELWMLQFGLLALLFAARGRTLWAAAFLALALLSKETAIVLPAVLVLMLIARREPRRRVLAVAAALAVVCALWIAVHPTLIARVQAPAAPTHELEQRPPVTVALAKTLGAQFNLDRFAPQDRAMRARAIAMVAGLALLALPLLLANAAKRPSSSDRRRTLALGLGWALVAGAAVMLPTIGWHAYYTALAGLGLWLAVAAVMPARRAVLVACVVVLGVLRLARVSAPPSDWGDEAYSRNAGWTMERVERSLFEAYPRLSQTRVYFWRVPNNIGLIAGEASALPFWYRDTSVTGHFLNAYQPVPGRRDLFFAFDTLALTMREIGTPAPDRLPPDAGVRREWAEDLQMVAKLLARGGDLEGAADRFRRAGEVDPRARVYEAACYLAEGRPSSADSVCAIAAPPLGLTPTEAGIIARRLAAALRL